MNSNIFSGKSSTCERKERKQMLINLGHFTHSIYAKHVHNLSNFSGSPHNTEEKLKLISAQTQQKH